MQLNVECDKITQAADPEVLKEGSLILFGEKQVRYLKPRIGTYFQAKVEKYIAPKTENLTVDGDEGGVKLAMLSCSHKIQDDSDIASSKRRRRGSYRATRLYTGELSEASQSSHPLQDLNVDSSGLEEYLSEACTNQFSNMTAHDPAHVHNAQWTMDGLKYTPLPGGLCVHRPSFNRDTNHHQNHDFFLAFCRNIFLQTPQSSAVSELSRERLWKEDEQWIRNNFSEEETVNAILGKRRGRKRKIDPINDTSSVHPRSHMIDETSSIKGTGTETDELIDVTSTSSKCLSRTPTSSPEVGEMDDELETKIHHSTQIKPMPKDWLIERDGSIDRSKELIDLSIIGLENDEAMLEYLQLRHNGDVDRGKFLTITSLSMGRSGVSRKLIRKIRMEEEYSRPLDTLPELSDSWRRRYERTISILKGDHRPTSSPNAYPYFKDNELPSFSEIDFLNELYPWCNPKPNNHGNKKIKQDSNLEKDQYTNSCQGEPFHSSEDIQTTWKSIIFAIKVISESLQKQNSFIKPTFRQVLNLIDKAYSLPKTEDAFGRRDALSRDVCIYMNSLMDHVDSCRNCLADIVDATFSRYSDGVDLSNLRKVLKKNFDKAPLIMEEFEIIQSMLEETSSWESKVHHMNEEVDSNIGLEELCIPQLRLSQVEDLARQGNSLSLRPSTLVLLEDKIQKAHLLKSKIIRWKKSVDDEHENIKYISTMIKEANKINLSFPELSILSKVHKNAEDWVEKAQIAIKTRISLCELDALVRSGVNMPIDFADVLAKLQSRYEQACEWISTLRDIIPCPSEHVSRSALELDPLIRDEWFERMMDALMASEDEVRVSNILELSSQGLRLTVEVDLLGLLQVAIDARNWSMKSKRWIPTLSGDHWKRGKFEDIEEHLKQADIIRDKRKAMTGRKSWWNLYYEQELEGILNAAEQWLNTYHPYIDGDNRRTQARPCLSYPTLRRIIEELEAIPCNVGSAGVKINKIFCQAQNWMRSHNQILRQCGVQLERNMIPEITSTHYATIDNLNSTVDIALRDIAVDLEEVKELQKVSLKARKWLDKVQEMAPKRNKRHARNKGSNISKYTKDEVLILIEEARNIPLDTSKEVERLTLQLSEVKAWCLFAQGQFRVIIKAFEENCKERNEYFGPLENFGKFLTRTSLECNPYVDDKCNNSFRGYSIDGKYKPSLIDDRGNEESNVHQMIASLLKSTEVLCILTAEETMVDFLDAVSVWYNSACALIDSPQEVYSEKKSFQEMDTLISEAEGLVKKRCQIMNFDKTEDVNLLSDLLQSCTSIITCDLDRLRFLRARRDEFYSWCEKALLLLSTDNEKPCSLDALLKLEEDGAAFPDSTETVRNFRTRASSAVKWASSVRQRINSGTSIPIEDAKNMVTEAENLNINCQELRTLRNAYRTTRGWIGRLKKIDLDLGSSDINIITGLLREHEGFLVSSNDHVTKLKQAVCGYCICRRPYDGFMIGCDECEEWYHGLCIGISESQAEKFEKYICLRCSIKKQYYQFCSSIANIIRKWCDPKELDKVRQNEGNKLQRRVRERKREILKVREEIESTTRLLENLSPDGCSRQTTGINAGETVAECTDLPKNANVIDVHDSLLTAPPTDIPFLAHRVFNTIDMTVEQKYTATANLNGSLVDEKQLQIAALKNNLQVHSKALEISHQRLNDVLNLVKERKALEVKEDATLNCLRYWFVLIRCKIFAPKSAEIANASRPMLPSTQSNKVELLSEPMKEAAHEATALELRDFVDVNTAISTFSSIGWCLIALSILSRKPKVEELQMLSTSYSAIKFPDAKCIGLIRSIIGRASSWQNQVKKLQDAIDCSNNPTPEVNVLQELLSTANSIPVVTEEYTWLENVIADECRTHCICERPLRMSLMLSCDACGKYFHGTCVQVSQVEAETLPQWLCSSCSGSSSNKIAPKIYSRVRRWKQPCCDDDVSSSAPNPAFIWPPFGLADSSEAVASFGALACSANVENMIRPQLKSQLKEDSDIITDVSIESSTDFINDASGYQSCHKENGRQPPQSLDDSGKLSHF